MNWFVRWYAGKKLTPLLKEVMTMGFLSGYKTYIAAAAFVVISGLQAQGYISQETASWLTTLLTGAGFAALRNAVK